MISQKIIFIQFLEIEEMGTKQANIFGIWQAWVKAMIMCRSRNNCFHVNCCHHGEKDTNPLQSSVQAGGFLQQISDYDFGANISKLHLWGPHRESLSPPGWGANDQAEEPMMASAN